ncbi:unnamed protein product [Allacma fusca]|uniref:Cytochrome P450 n=1 Tax=Allacma fusca TaxID=39272 RepID=A0A8J2PNU9_9HEXA|nr:unnamed protein product [Allacma fusca]
MSLFDNNPSALLALSLGVLIIYLIFLTESKVLKFLKSYPGPTLYPVLGNAWQVRNPVGAFKVIEEWSRIYGSRFRIILGTSIRGLLLSDPKDVEKVLASSVLIDKGAAYDAIIPWLGTGLLISRGKKWHTRRKQLTPAFHFKILESFQEIFNTESKVLVDILKEKLAKNEACEIHGLFTRCALDIICETAMGKKLSCQRNLDHPYAVATIEESAFVWLRWTSPWLHSNMMWSLSSVGRRELANRKVLHDFTNQVIQERKQKFLENSKELEKNIPENDEFSFSTKKKFAFLDLLISIQAQGEIEMTDQDIREETDTFMFEGHDTTAAALTWTLHLLAKNPEQQVIVHEELDSVFGDDRERPVTPEDLTQLKFLECCIKEGLRLYPSVPFFMRSVLKDFKLDDKTTLPAGASVFISPWLTHRNPEIYPEPEKYLPSRFFPENSIGRHPYAYIPFSAGPRNCIGQKFALTEEKIVLSSVLRNFSVDVVSKDEVTPLPELIVRPHNGIELKFTPR